jgi:hypothetical protein
MDINYKGSQGQTERATVLQEEEKLSVFAKNLQEGGTLMTKTVANSIEKSSLATHLWRLREKRRYSFYSFTTSALDGDKWSASRPKSIVQYYIIFV